MNWELIEVFPNREEFTYLGIKTTSAAEQGISLDLAAVKGMVR